MHAFCYLDYHVLIKYRKRAVSTRGGVLTPNFGRYVPRQSEKWARAPERAPGRAWKCGAPERAWAVLSLKMRGSGTSSSLFERENANLRNELDPFWAWKCVSPERPRTRGDAERKGLSRPWEATNEFKLKKFWKWWSPERQNPPKNVKWWCSGTDFLVICENYMLRNGNSGLKMGVSRAAHTQYAYIWKYPPPPPHGSFNHQSWINVNSSQAFNIRQYWRCSHPSSFWCMHSTVVCACATVCLNIPSGFAFGVSHRPGLWARCELMEGCELLQYYPIFKVIFNFNLKPGSKIHSNTDSAHMTSH